jgi:hypothetical protein
VHKADVIVPVLADPCDSEPGRSSLIALWMDWERKRSRSLGGVKKASGIC